MARKKKTKIPRPSNKIIFIVILALMLLGGIWAGVNTLLRSSGYFKVKVIQINSVLKFIENRDVAYLLGKSIFLVDLNNVHRKLKFRYPSISHLKVLKRFPDKIEIAAKKREPFAYSEMRGKNVVVDNSAVVLKVSPSGGEELPLIAGVQLDQQRISLGMKIKGSDVHIAIAILNEMRKYDNLSAYKVTTINVENLSKIILEIDKRFQVLMDRSKIDQKVRILSFVLVKGRIDLKEVKYIDLRFKEPIIGKK